MKGRLFAALNDLFEGRVYLQGTIEPFEEYPDTFVTFFTNDTEDTEFFDNKVHSIDWTFSVILYSNEPDVIEYKPAEIIAALKAEGFIPQGRGRDIPSDVPTHTGWAMEFVITEYINN